MKKSTSLKGFCVLAVVVFLCGLSEAVNCTQCNMRQRGIPNTCKSPRNMTRCMGCMKTITKVKLRDTGYMTGLEKMSVVVSRYCMRNGSTKIRPAGCYLQQNNGGYTERCFCYSDYCNSGAAKPVFWFFSSIFSSSLFTMLEGILVVIFAHTFKNACEFLVTRNI